jgi:hypothetical protein
MQRYILSNAVRRLRVPPRNMAALSARTYASITVSGSLRERISATRRNRNLHIHCMLLYLVHWSLTWNGNMTYDSPTPALIPYLYICDAQLINSTLVVKRVKGREDTTEVGAPAHLTTPPIPRR